MANVLQSYDFVRSGTKGGRNWKYPWAEWMNGQIWKAVRYHDFTCTADGFAGSLHNRARTANKSVRSQITDNKQSVVFQFTEKEVSNGQDA